MSFLKANLRRNWNRSCRIIQVNVFEGGVPFTGGAGLAAIDTVSGWREAFCTAFFRGGQVNFSVPDGRSSALLTVVSSAQKSGTGPLLATSGDESVDIDLDGGGGGQTGNPAEISDTIMERAASGDVTPVARDVVAVQRDGSAWRVVGNGRSDSETGVYTVSGLVEPGADVYLIALDDLGAVFESGASVESDDLIHPTTPNGYVYRVVTGGDLPATEPDWWSTGQQQVGTATLEAREYLRPLAHGPVDVTFL